MKNKYQFRPELEPYFKKLLNDLQGDEGFDHEKASKKLKDNMRMIFECGAMAEEDLFIREATGQSKLLRKI